MLERTSAIAAGLAATSRLHGGAAGVRLGEVRGWGLLQVAGFGDGMAGVEQVVGAACGVTVPSTVGAAFRAGEVLVMRTGPEQLWIIGPNERLAVEPTIRGGLATGIGVATSLSHSRSRIFIEGARARDVLAKEIAVDLDPGLFEVDRFALTGFDHTPVLLHRAGVDRFEIYAMRTFALAVWERLTDGALEFGYDTLQ